MLNRLHLENFRSVASTTLTFSQSGLDVLVGANGSGKTNIVRAIEFVGEIHRSDMSTAIARQGGQRSLVPKSVPYREISSVETVVDFEVQLDRPDGYPEDATTPSGSHALRFRTKRRNSVELVSEVLRFSEPLAVAAALSDGDQDERDAGAWKAVRESWIKFARKKRGATEVTMRPNLSDDNVGGYVSWFGLAAIESSQGFSGDRDQFSSLLDALQRQVRVTDRTPLQALGPTWLALALAPQVHRFADAARRIRRFDLQLPELRSDQQPTSRGALEATGRNLASVVRGLRAARNRTPNWARILETLHDIAPYVFDVKEGSLKSGAEFVAFVEGRTGRAVESWDASDGTLRTLAMLIALESHPQGNTLVLEEPEKGLHPWAIRSLMHHVREVIERRGIQVVVTTHSPQVLEAVNPSEVFVVSRELEAGTVVERASKLVSNESVTPGDLGRLWVKGLIGGFPRDV